MLDWPFEIETHSESALCSWMKNVHFFSKLRDKRGTPGTRVLVCLLIETDSCDFMFVCAAIFSENQPERFVR